MTDQHRAGSPWAPDVRRLTGEFVGTAFLLAAVVGSGIMAQNLTDDVGLQLLQNAFATAGVLVALILAFGSVSGAHFNPAVTLTDRWFGGIDTPTAAWYIAAQTAGGIVGAMAANIMFAEGVATLGLLLVIFGVVRSGRTSAVAFAVGGYIAGAYYFTSSTSFANPAVTVARMFSDTFAGIRPADAPAFISAQLVAVVVGIALIRVLFPGIDAVADRVVLPHDDISSGV